MPHLPVGSLPVLDRTCKQGKENTGMRDNQTTRRMPMIVTAMACATASMLAVFERDLRVRVGKYHLRLSGLRGQQRQALTAVLPLGL